MPITETYSRYQTLFWGEYLCFVNPCPQSDVFWAKCIIKAFYHSSSDTHTHTFRYHTQVIIESRHVHINSACFQCSAQTEIECKHRFAHFAPSSCLLKASQCTCTIVFPPTHTTFAHLCYMQNI